MRAPTLAQILGGSWLVISGVISPPIWVVTMVTLLITPRITTHESPSRILGFWLPVVLAERLGKETGQTST